MPLIVKDYSWTQTESKVHISVPLKGMNAKQVDIFATDEYLKVHFPPFFFEAFLFAPVYDDKSIAKIGNGVALFTLQKQKEELWDQLSNNEDKCKQKEIREKAILKAQEKATADSQAKAEKQQEESKFALKTMMKLEEEERARIEKIKHEECKKAATEFENWKLKHTLKEEEEAVQSQQHNIQSDRNTETCEISKADRLSESRSSGRLGIPQQGKENVPGPRSCGNIKVNFTPRVFPTALRESRLPDEEEWLKKQAEARRTVAADLAELDDLKPEERNPDWLKEKGDKFFVAGNYQAALNAYNLALKLNRKLPALYSNRAACHLKLRNLHKAIEDSSQALELLNPPVADNASARLKAHVRRGTAFCELELYVEGLQEYQAALKIDPNNPKLQEDVQKIRDIVQGASG
ncbi:dynein assembly factor 4, axonemal isoform X2 [Clupea harengus]|uniref:Dynein axonemal assembly factor 4 n=1 Tax=Clupea harengus TaxID=7950 RepID=A0A6P3VFM6_CLUHA|nr:dynein assembly factor 4, axonemal isoform X2 [Clupea harengus]